MSASVHCRVDVSFTSTYNASDLVVSTVHGLVGARRTVTPIHRAHEMSKAFFAVLWTRDISTDCIQSEWETLTLLSILPSTDSI